MKKVYFITHYFKRRIEIRLSDEAYNKLTSNQKYNPYELYLHDTWAHRWHEKTDIFTDYQIRKLNRLDDNGDVVDNIEVDGKVYNYYSYN